MSCSHDRDESFCTSCTEMISAISICREYGLDETLKLLRADAKLRRDQKHHHLTGNLRRIYLSAARQLGEEKLLQVLATTKNARWMFWVAFYVLDKRERDPNDSHDAEKVVPFDHSADFFDKLAMMIINIGDCLTATSFIEILPVSESSKNSVLELVLKNRLAGSAHHFANFYWRNLPEKTIEKLANIVIDTSKEHPFQSFLACSFAKNVSKVSKEVLNDLLKVIVNKRDVREAHRFLRFSCRAEEINQDIKKELESLTSSKTQ